jgi:PAS domain S-box-containing protein
MMSDSFSNLFEDRTKRFSSFWFAVIKIRLILCAIIALITFGTPEPFPTSPIFLILTVYFAFNFAIGLVNSYALQQKKVRVIPEIVDVIFISFLTYFTGGQNSPWFLLYFFPIISVSRYLGYEGSFPLALLSSAAYLSLSKIYGDKLDFYSSIVKIIAFFGIALVTGNLFRSRQQKEDTLVDFFKEINNAILNNTEADKVFTLILEKALKFTNSELGYLRIVDSKFSARTMAVIKTGTLQPEWQMDSFTERYYAKVLETQKPFSILAILSQKTTNKASRQGFQDAGSYLIHIYWDYMEAHMEAHKETPKSALFVPLILNGEVKGIIALYAKSYLHYSHNEAKKLESLAQLIGIALKSSELYQETIDSEKEKKQRLKMLYEIGEQLRVEQGLQELFQNVVGLTYKHLYSEEASLFILDEKNQDVVQKKAVKSPSEEISKQLKDIEKPYERGSSLIGEIFASKEYKHLRIVDSEVEYQNEFTNILPSGHVCHYIGVPLLIGDEILGVIRVINKRSPGYSLEDENFELSEEGFSQEDVELMQTIASQVASAIRSANFIEVQRYYQEIVENSPDPIIMLDNRGRITFFNQACEKIMGRSFKETKGASIVQYYESEGQARQVDRQLKISSTRRVQDFPAKVRARNGDLIPVSLSASLLLDKEGRRIGSIGIFKDIRETLKLQEEKTRAEKLAALGQLAHTMGHEIKHLIATALNYVSALPYIKPSEEESLEIYRDIEESLREAVDKFQNMLMIGKPRPPVKMPLQANDILQEVEPSMRRRAKNEQIDLVATYPQSGFTLQADREQLKQVLFNLFDNSLDAIRTKQKRELPEKGRIEFIAEAVNGELQVRWRDNGCGISEKNLANIFTPFVTNKPTGNGLGLFIVQNVIENHGGKITVESEEGTGTDFIIKLPLLTETIM